MVYNSFRRYVENGNPQDEQGKKLKNLLHYVHQVVIFLGEDYTKNPPKTMSEIQKAEAYIHKIVVPYINKLQSEKTKKPSSDSTTQPHGGSSGGQPNIASGFYGQNTSTAENAYLQSDTYNENSTATSSGMGDFNLSFGMGGQQQNQFQMSLGTDMPGGASSTSQASPSNTSQPPTTTSTTRTPDNSQGLITLVET